MGLFPVGVIVHATSDARLDTAVTATRATTRRLTCSKTWRRAFPRNPIGAWGSMSFRNLLALRVCDNNKQRHHTPHDQWKLTPLPVCSQSSPSQGSSVLCNACGA